MVLTETGSSAGAISGGCLESDLERRIPEICAAGRPVEIVYDMTSEDDVVWGLGLGCNGRVKVAVSPVDASLAGALDAAAARHAKGLSARLPGEDEEIEPPPALLLGGAGRDAAPLARLARALGWRVTVDAPRVSDASRRRFPEGVSFAGLEDPASLGTPAFAVVMTHNFLDDLSLLERLASSRATAGGEGADGSLAYLGILGPRARTDRLLAALGESRAGLPETIHSPAGLDLGAETPEEIALAILAEMQAVRRGRGGGESQAGFSIRRMSQVCRSTRG
jgi:xanthine/CO dehydrogenase XdhC/CoxF family maturation factor